MKTNIKGGWLTVNRACNLRCPWCYAVAEGFNSSDNMEIELAKKLLTLFSELGMKKIILIGGEPTIYPNLIETISFAKEKGLLPVLITNGRRLADINFFKKIVDAGISDITISLKALDGISYDGFLPGAGEKVFSEIKTAICNAKLLGAGINLSVTLFRTMLNSLDKLKDVLLELNPNSISIDMGSPVIDQDKVTAVDLLNPLELARTVEKIHNMLKDTNLNYGFYITIPLCLIDKGVLDDIMKQEKILTTCHVAKGSGLIFTHDGHVILCNHFSSKPIGQFGVDFSNIKELNEFWSSEQMGELRSCCSCYPHIKCKECSIWDKCGGGCFLKWFHWDPKEFIY
jgi:radical SAM protein with 4Fe4S-binding SPASM domain